MDWWMIVLVAFGCVVLTARFALGPIAPPSAEEKEPGDPSFNEPEPEPWTAEALARYGTETSVADLAAQGRTDELRGLGYRGDIPDS